MKNSVISTELKTIVKPQDPSGAFIVWLCARFPYLSQEGWMKHIESGKVLLNQVQADPNQEVQVGDEISYFIQNHEEGEFPQECETIWQNEHFILVSKPADLPIHRSGRIFWNTLVNMVRREQKSEEIYPLHRLDRETSGLVFMVKQNQLRRQLKFALDRVLGEKVYLAWVWGDWKSIHQDSLVHIQTPLLERQDSPIKIQMHPIAKSDPLFAQAKSAHTEVIGLWSGELTPNLPQSFPQTNEPTQTQSLVAVRIHTGRKHQIRAHLASENFPIIGDKIYSQGGAFYLKRAEQSVLTESDFATLGASTQLLHAFRLQVKIPPTSPERGLAKVQIPDLEHHTFYSKFWSFEFEQKMAAIIAQGFDLEEALKLTAFDNSAEQLA